MLLREKLAALLTIYSKREIYDLTRIERTTLWRIQSGKGFSFDTYQAIDKLYFDSKRKIAAKRRAKC